MGQIDSGGAGRKALVGVAGDSAAQLTWLEAQRTLSLQEFREDLLCTVT